MPSASSAHTLPFLERLLDGEKVEWKTLGEVCVHLRTGLNPRRNFKLNTEDASNYYVTVRELGGTELLYSEKTDLINDDALQLINNRSKLKVNDILFSGTGTIGKTAFISKEPTNWNIKEGVYALTLNTHYVLPMFVLRYLQTQSTIDWIDRMAAGGIVRSITMKNLEQLPIPVPPLRIQSRIVEILDKFTQLEAELEDELTKELEARNKQYDFYRNRLLSGPLPHSPNIPHQWEQVPLGSIGEVRMCKRILKQDTTETGEIPFYKIGTFGKSADAFISRTLFEEYKQKYAYPRIGDILISASGTIGRAIEFDGQDAYFQDSNIVWLEHDDSKVLNRFLYYCYQIADWKVSKGGTIARLYNDNIKKTLIPLPPLSEQRRIAEILDRFDTLTHSISEGTAARDRSAPQAI